jgi:hypothetical protein
MAVQVKFTWKSANCTQSWSEIVDFGGSDYGDILEQIHQHIAFMNSQNYICVSQEVLQITGG